jgi:hypothetical protein
MMEVVPKPKIYHSIKIRKILAVIQYKAQYKVLFKAQYKVLFKAQ